MSFPAIVADRGLFDREGVELHFVAADRTSHTPRRPIIFIHGWCCDRRFFSHQISYFWALNRLFVPDLRGHGASDAPRQRYSVASFVDDVSWQCDRLNIRDALVVGHSMGGTIALELAAQRPDIAAGIAMIDSVLLPPAPIVKMLRGVGDALNSQSTGQVIRNTAASLFLETDCEKRRSDIIDAMAGTTSHVAVSAFHEHLFAYIPPDADRLNRTALAYITSTGLSDVEALRAAYPDIRLSATLGVGHFSPLEAPGQINAMLDRFLLLLPADRDSSTGAAGLPDSRVASPANA